MNWKTSRWLIIDTETTGVDTSTARVVELGWAIFLDGELRASASTLVNPDMPIPPEVSAIHGITDVMVADAPLIDVAWSLVEPLILTCQVVAAYNWPFDSTILRRLVGPRFDSALDGRTVLDPLVAVRELGKFWPGSGRHRLGKVCERLKIDVGSAFHRAEADCVAAGKVLWHVKDGLPDNGLTAVYLQTSDRMRQDREREEYFARLKAAEKVRLVADERARTYESLEEGIEAQRELRRKVGAP